MDIIKIISTASVYLLLSGSDPAWAVVRTEPSKGTPYLFIVVVVLGSIIALLGILLAFRGVTSPAKVSIKVSGIGTFKANNVGQGVVLAIIGAIIIVAALYLYPPTTTKTVTETTTIEGEDGTHTTRRTMAR